jgi:hypothetical protein
VDVAPPPGDDAAEASAPGQLTFTVDTTAPTIDLTAGGTLDWIHWGSNDARSVDRKAAGSGAISAFASIGTNAVTQYNDNPTSFSWSDGAPTATESGTTTGIYVSGVNHGVSLDVAADTAPRTLRLYVGGYKGAAELDARLSDGSATPITDRSKSYSNGAFDAVYTIVFAAGRPGERVSITWTLWRDDATLPGDTGNATLQAAALQ